MTRYRAAIGETVYLAGVSSVLDLVFGYPFAYILIRKIRYREFVRTMMTFPLFGPLYLAFGLFYILLPNGPLGGIFRRCSGSMSPSTSSPRGGALFDGGIHLSVHGDEHRRRTLQCRSHAGRGRADARRQTWQTFHSRALPAELERHCRRIPDVLWLESGRVRPAAVARARRRSRRCISLQMFTKGLGAVQLRACRGARRAADGDGLWRDLGLAALFARRTGSIGAADGDRGSHVRLTGTARCGFESQVARECAGPWLRLGLARRLRAAVPGDAGVLAADSDGVWTLSAYQYVFGSFKENLLLSVQTTVITIIINLLIAVPAAYAIVRYPIPGKSFILSALNLSLYTPAAVMGVSLVIAYAFLFDIPQTLTGLIAAYVVGTFPADAGSDHRRPARSARRLRGGGAHARRDPDADLLADRAAAARTRHQRRHPAHLRHRLQRVPGHALHRRPGTTTAALRVYNLTRTRRLPTLDGGAGHDDAARLVHGGARLLPLLRLALPEGDVPDLDDPVANAVESGA